MTLRPLVLLLFLTLTACAGVPAVDDGRAAALEGFSSPGTALNHHLTIGEIALDQRDFPAAADAYLAAMTLSDDPEVAAQATRLALHVERPVDALRAAGRWQALAPDDVRPNEAEVVAALRAGQKERAERAVTTLLTRRNAPDEEAFRALARLLLDEGDQGAVLRILRRVAERHGTGVAWEIAALSALRADDVEFARRAVARARVLDPESAHAAMLEARILTLSGDAERGMALMQAIVAEHPDDPTLRFTLAGLHLHLEQLDAARAVLEALVADVPAYLDARWTLAMLLMQQQDADAAEPHLRALLADPARRWDVPYYLGGVHEIRGDWATALAWFDGVEWGDQLFNARIKAAQMLFKLERFDEGRARLATMRAEHPDEHLRLYRIEAELFSRAAQWPDALAVLDQVLAAFPDDAATLYTRANTLERAGRYQDAIADLRGVYALLPDDPEVQNALGYVMADRGEPAQWDEARALIAIALEAEPDNAAFIDSMGWVLYRQGKWDAAREWLARSWALDRNPEVAAHLGEVLWMLGEHAAARAVWEEAADIDADHPVLVATLARLLATD